MRKSLLFRTALLALALTQTMQPVYIASSRFDRAPPNQRLLVPRTKNRREKFRPPKIIRGGNARNMRTSRR
jgi:hypothetical protein